MMKKIMVLLFVVLLSMIAGGCSPTQKEADDKIKIVTTIFPAYDWAKELTKDVDDIEISMLLDNGADLHNYQPSAEDIIKIKEADLFIYVGGESEKWADDLLANDKINKLAMMEVLKDQLKEEEHDEENIHGHEDEHEGEHEYDEHVWLSLRNAGIIMKSLAENLSDLQPDKVDIYRKNMNDYLDRLADLDMRYQQMIAAAPNDTVVFADRFPFQYLLADYDINHYAAFASCSTDVDASFATITTLSNKINELDLKYVLVLENSKQAIAKTIINAAKKENVEILTLNSLQMVNADDLAMGSTYLQIMEDNLSTLAKALN